MEMDVCVPVYVYLAPVLSISFPPCPWLLQITAQDEQIGALQAWLTC